MHNTFIGHYVKQYDRNLKDNTLRALGYLPCEVVITTLFVKLKFVNSAQAR